MSARNKEVFKEQVEDTAMTSFEMEGGRYNLEGVLGRWRTVEGTGQLVMGLDLQCSPHSMTSKVPPNPGLWAFIPSGIYGCKPVPF